MSNTAGFGYAAKVKALAALVAAGTYKAALYLASASISGATLAYTTSGEVSGANYTAGGVSAGAWAAAAQTGGTAFSTPSGNITFSNVTLATAFDCALIYDTADSNLALGAFTFGSQTVTAADFVLQMPANTAAAGLLRIA